uniref:NADH-quinone oxidoreductase subunit C n=1 Tax=uncultured bacterium contig00001 TaxID=1181493 RepID=A0A806K0Q9_9BACT|nr:NADH-ubiquinone oxidoreductase chain C [uncultured bacterium contig00001]
MIIESIEESMPGAIVDRHDFRGDQTITIDLLKYLDIVKFIFDEGFQLMIDLTAVDWLERDPRFDIVVHFQNLVSQERLRVKAPVADGQPVPSVTSVHKCANWFEREVFDLFGIPFDGHPDLKRLMMWDDFSGHPLRKDFPIDGGDPWCNSDVQIPYATNARSLAEP